MVGASTEHVDVWAGFVQGMQALKLDKSHSDARDSDSASPASTTHISAPDSLDGPGVASDHAGCTDSAPTSTSSNSTGSWDNRSSRDSSSSGSPPYMPYSAPAGAEEVLNDPAFREILEAYSGWFSRVTPIHLDARKRGGSGKAWPWS